LRLPADKKILCDFFVTFVADFHESKNISILLEFIMLLINTIIKSIGEAASVCIIYMAH
jgi:hypothetical protein